MVWWQIVFKTDKTFGRLIIKPLCILTIQLAVCLEFPFNIILPASFFNWRQALQKRSWNPYVYSWDFTPLFHSNNACYFSCSNLTLTNISSKAAAFPPRYSQVLSWTHHSDGTVTKIPAVLKENTTPTPSCIEYIEWFPESNIMRMPDRNENQTPMFYCSSCGKVSTVIIVFHPPPPPRYWLIFRLHWSQQMLVYKRPDNCIS